MCKIGADRALLNCLYICFFVSFVFVSTCTRIYPLKLVGEWLTRKSRALRARSRRIRVKTCVCKFIGGIYHSEYKQPLIGAVNTRVFSDICLDLLPSPLGCIWLYIDNGRLVRCWFWQCRWVFRTDGDPYESPCVAIFLCLEYLVPRGQINRVHYTLSEHSSLFSPSRHLGECVFFSIFICKRCKNLSTL